VPSNSKTEHVVKRCDCSKWKECKHPWYLDYQEGRRRYRRNLDQLIGRHCVDFADAKIEAGRAVRAWLDGRSVADLLPSDRPTLTTLLSAYRQRPGSAINDEYQVGPILRTVIDHRPFGDWPADRITREILEAYRRQRPKVAANRDLALLRAMFNWAILKGVLTATPFKVGAVAVVTLSREEARTRRLQPGEAETLHAAAGGLQDLITAALETGCRRGELLSLQWHQVRADLFLPGSKTKAKKDRRVPISSVLRAVLDRRRVDPAGDTLPPAAYVFGDEVGRQRRSIKTAWKLTLQRAKIHDLHFHDLRREAGSRWMDAGVPLSTIQRWLGHSNIAQTSTYLAATGGGDADAMAAFEAAAGRLVTRGDALSSTSRSEPSRTDTATHEKTQENTIVH